MNSLKNLSSACGLTVCMSVGYWTTRTCSPIVGLGVFNLSSATSASICRGLICQNIPQSMEKCFSFYCQQYQYMMCPLIIYLCTVSDFHSLGVSAVLKQFSSIWHINWNMSCKHEVHVVITVKLRIDFWPKALQGVSLISQGWCFVREPLIKL